MSANADILDFDEPPRRDPPKWLPYTLIAIGGAAVVVPIILLRRLRPADAVISKTLSKGSAPPVRKAAPNVTAQSSSPISSGSISKSASLSPKISVEGSGQVSQEAVLDDGPFMALKAFGIATCMVAAGALASVWVVRTTMGVQTVDEFADKMRNTVQSMTPNLSSRIYRRPTPSDDTEVSLPPISTAVKSESHSAAQSTVNVTEGSREWNWDNAAERLYAAYKEGGFAVWMEVAGKELEKEASAERSRRDHGPAGSSAL
ncbi:hypothetical protein M422DRAFT_71307 [Sphaerobolus stellatus SS14]|uniref:Unplaced genomic scaffold SPHSTscaffold_216, whole genome shotgun sequence n=1 Tax=Sphaerobolus stellatus (strain SS14) TaxID=990650 RepID=A0A0C9UJH3_SPHS4|nr:hypothetical protein M422DRAFT_71307 [Sphaerobolus stellatus SS14]